MKFLRSKLAVVVLAVGSFAGVANAAQMLVYEAPINDLWRDISAEFAVNRDLGRAWIDVELTTQPQGDEPPTQQVIMKKVDGLYYDQARKQVLYRAASGPVVCAEDATFLWRTYLKSTGQCLLTAQTEKRQVDNGFELHEQTVAEVTFDAQAPAAEQHAATSSL